jgi:TPR repeat protein
MERWLMAWVATLVAIFIGVATQAQQAGRLLSAPRSTDAVSAGVGVAGSGSVPVVTDDPASSLWVRRSPKDAALHARRKGLERRYWQAGANPQFFDRMVGGDMVGALNDLKKRALAGDGAAINLYGDFVYWNCFLGRSLDQLDSYAAMQMRESRTLPVADAEWFRAAFMEDIAFDKAVMAACGEAVNVDQAFDLVDERAKQGDGESLRLASMTANMLPEMQRLLRAAATAGSADAQFEIAFVVLGGHQPELLGTGPDTLNVGDLLRRSAEQIPQAEGNLASCEFYGCVGISPDPAAGLRTALSAAEHGFFDALLDIGPHLTPSQLDPVDFEAWKLIQASVGMQCGQSWTDVKTMRATLGALSSPAATDAARKRAEQLWVRYGAQLGC